MVSARRQVRLPYAEPDDDDAARVHIAKAKAAVCKVEALLNVPTQAADRAFLVRIGREAHRYSADDIERVQAMAWKYRRGMPDCLRPKLPPHDPIVRAMMAEGLDG